MSAPIAFSVSKNLSGRPIPANAKSLCPRSRDAAVSSGARRAVITGRPRACASAPTRAPAAPSPAITMASVLLELRVERGAQRPRGNAQAVSDANGAVHHGDGEILLQRRVLQSVIHDENARAGLDRQPRACNAIGAHHSRRDARQKQRLVADVRRAVPRRIDDARALDRPARAIAAREKEGRMSRALHLLRQRHRGRRLASAAGDEISHADDRRIHARAGLVHAPRSDGAIDRAERRQQVCDGVRPGFPPERRGAHHCRPNCICST